LNSNKVMKPLEIVHMDVWGPSPTVSKLESKYYVMFLDSLGYILVM
jgi:hypothetical protein